jgi:DnaJ-class molecular chaperone
MRKIKQWIITPKFKFHYEAMLPARRVVCPRCDGIGTQDHSAFSDGITQSELEEMDCESRHSYARGDYDEACSMCHGENVVDELDYGNLSDKMKKAVDDALEQQARDDMDAAWEKAWGA